VSTNAGLAAGAVEANPLMAAAQESLGAWWAAPKVALQLLTATIVLAHPSRAVFICVGAVTSVNAAVVINNLALAGIF